MQLKFRPDLTVDPSRPAAPPAPPRARSGTFGPLEQVDAGVVRILKGIGHEVPQEAPDALAKAIVDADGHLR